MTPKNNQGYSWPIEDNPPWLATNYGYAKTSFNSPVVSKDTPELIVTHDENNMMDVLTWIYVGIPGATQGRIQKLYDLLPGKSKKSISFKRVAFFMSTGKLLPTEEETKSQLKMLRETLHEELMEPKLATRRTANIPLNCDRIQEVIKSLPPQEVMLYGDSTALSYAARRDNDCRSC